jgi:hypothetical protein
MSKKETILLLIAFIFACLFIYFRYKHNEKEQQISFSTEKYEQKIKQLDSLDKLKELEIKYLHEENDSLILLKQKVKKIYEKEIIYINSDNISLKQLDSIIRTSW